MERSVPELQVRYLRDVEVFGSAPVFCTKFQGVTCTGATFIGQLRLLIWEKIRAMHR